MQGEEQGSRPIQSGEAEVTVVGRYSHAVFQRFAERALASEPVTEEPVRSSVGLFRALDVDAKHLLRLCEEVRELLLYRRHLLAGGLGHAVEEDVALFGGARAAYAQTSALHEAARTAMLAVVEQRLSELAGLLYEAGETLPLFAPEDAAGPSPERAERMLKDVIQRRGLRERLRRAAVPLAMSDNSAHRDILSKLSELLELLDRRTLPRGW